MNSKWVGQAKRLLGGIRSGHPAAWLGMALKALGPGTRVLDGMVYNFLAQDRPEAGVPPCVMIVSPPRSGSTITYQVLTRAIPSVYISNWHALFPRLASRSLLKGELFGRNLSGFRNFYGHTSHLRDVNEGNEIIGGWFQENEQGEALRRRFARFVSVMQASPDRPFIFKNVRHYAKVLRLHQAVPEMVFLRIRRDPEQVVQSVVKAYHELGTFHPIPPALASSGTKDYVEFAVRQVFEIEKALDGQLQQINPACWVEWRYEEFCSNHREMIAQFASKYLKLDPAVLRLEALAEPLKASTRVKVSEQEAQRIKHFMEQIGPLYRSA